MKSEHFLKEGFVEDASDVHADHEVQMARSDLFHAAEDALVLHKLLRNVSEQQGLEGWVAAKITLASDYLKTVREYIEYELMTAASEQPMLPIAEGSGSKEKQKTPYRDINSPEHRAAADKQKQQMAKDAAAEPGKKLADKIAKKGVAEGEYKSRHIHRQEQNKKYDEYRRSQEAAGKKPMSRGDWAATQRKGQQGVAEGSLEEDKGMTGYNAFKREWRAKHGADAKVPAYDSKEYTSYVYRQNDKKQGVTEGSSESVSLRDMVDVVDKHYPKYYAELSGSDISDKQFERAIVNAYKKIMQKQGVTEGNNSDVSDISDSDYMRIKGIVDKKYPGYELSSLGMDNDGNINVEIYNYETHDVKHLKTKSTQGIAEGSDEKQSFKVSYHNPKTRQDKVVTIKAPNKDEVLDYCANKGYKNVHVEQGVSEDDSAVQSFLSKGGKIQQLPYKKPRKADKTDYGSKHIGGSGDKMKASRTGTAAKTQGNKVAGMSEGSACNHTMEGKSCPMHGLKECPGYKSSIEETTAGSVAGVVNPTPKNKAKVGTLFGGTYKQKKTKA